MQTDRVAAQWYDLFLDLWNMRYKLEQQPRAWLAEMWKHFGGDPIAADEPSVLVTAMLLQVRSEFVALDRSSRDEGLASDEALDRLRKAALELHNRWAALFRAERIA